MTEPTTDEETEIETSETSLTVRRTFDAPRERVFDAFTQADSLEQWYAPGEMTPEVHALEPEPGGRLSISMHAGEERHDAEGTFVEVVEDERLVHTWRWTTGESDHESRVTVEFVDVDGGTEVVLTHEELSDPESVENHAEGWAGTLENLAAAL